MCSILRPAGSKLTLQELHHSLSASFFLAFRRFFLSGVDFGARFSMCRVPSAAPYTTTSDSPKSLASEGVSSSLYSLSMSSFSSETSSSERSMGILGLGVRNPILPVLSSQVYGFACSEIYTEYCLYA